MNNELYPLKDSLDRLNSQVQDSAWLVGVMVTILRQYFGTTDRLTFGKANLLWQDDVAKSQVQIDVVDNLIYDESSKYPKILVDLETSQFPQDALGDVASVEGRTGKVHYTNRRVCQYAIECWAPRKMESRAIADEVFFFIQSFRQILMKQYGFISLRAMQTIKPAKYPQYDDYWIARVVINFEKNLNWSVAQEALKISNFTININQQ